MAIKLSQEDFDRVTSLLNQHGEWRSVRGRIDFMNEVFAGSPRKADILGQLDLDGNPHTTAVRVVDRLAAFGQDQTGRESLGILINRLIAHLGGGDDADYLLRVLARCLTATLPVTARGITKGWRGRETDSQVAEKIIGENTLRDVYALEVLLDLSKAVARIRGPGGLGTGFLIADDLLMTNHHVVGSVAEARDCHFEFNYQLERTGRAAVPLHTARAAEGGLFYTSPMASSNATAEELDYTIVQLTGVPVGTPTFSIRAESVQRDARLTIIQHPGGGYKKISLQNNFAEYADKLVVQYTTSTEPGSSGSPVLNESFNVVAIHHAGGSLSEPTTKRRYLRNEGILMSPVLADLRRRAPGISARVRV